MDRAIRASFPAARSGVYLNSAAVGPLAEVTIDAISAQLRGVAARGAANISEWLCAKEHVRSRIASMLGGGPKDIAFTRNTTDGLCAVAAGIKWAPEDNIVSFIDEFPANYYPWRNVRDKYGVELRLGGGSNGRVDVDELCSLIDSHTRVVAVSAVQYASGFRIDLERIGRIARSHDSLFVVDIIQAFGAMSFDLPAQFVDVAAGSSYKWLCGPEGCGFFYANDRARDRISPVSRGWTSVSRAWDFADRDQPVVSEARAWETGMGGTALICGLEASLQMLCSIGMSNVESYLGELTDFLCEIVPRGRYEVVSSRRPSERSQIVCLKPLNGHTSDEITTRLADERIWISSRSGALRIAPHVFNNFEDIECLVEALP